MGEEIRVTDQLINPLANKAPGLKDSRIQETELHTVRKKSREMCPATQKK